MTGAFALAAGRGWGTAWVVAAVLAGQLSIGWSNDLVDRRRDVAAGRTDKPVARGDVPVRLVTIATAVAAVAVVPLSLASGWRAGLAHLLGVASGWAYNLGLKATPVSPLPYAIAFGSLPSFVVLGLPGHPLPPWWITAAGALLGVGAHFVNVVPDLDDDLREGIRGLPHRFGRLGSTLAAGLLLTAASCLLAFGPGAGAVAVGTLVVTVALLLTASIISARRPGSRAPFRAAIAVAVIDIVLLVARGRGLGV